jgi:cyanuric acid amidohydrolase
VGTAIQATTVAATIQSLISDLNVSSKQVHLVLIKCPLLTTAKMTTATADGQTIVTNDTYESMAVSRHASAVGIAKALGEIDETAMRSAITGDDNKDVWSARASCSSGAELDNCHIFILASDEFAAEDTVARLRAISSFMADAIDAPSIMRLLEHVKQEGGEVVQVFAKAEADPSGVIRGSRHTMSTDSDLHSTRHARAAVGGLIAGLTGDCEVYVSGGAEGQGPVGGGSLCVVYRIPYVCV